MEDPTLLHEKSPKRMKIEDKLKKSFQIKHFWIIEKISSRNIFYHDFSKENELDGILLSGLLSALSTFSEQKIGHHGIESIKMGNLSWVYLLNNRENLLYVAATNYPSHYHLVRAQLSVFNKMFIKQFKITPNFWEEWDSDINQFMKFSETVDTLQFQWNKARLSTNVGEAFDLLGIFQHLFIKLSDVVTSNFVGMKLKHILLELNTLPLKLEKWYRKDKYNHAYHIIEIYIPKIDMEKEKIIFRKAPVNQLFEMKIEKLQSDLLIPLFYTALKHYIATISNALGEGLWVKIIKMEIMPYIFRKWDLFNKLDILKDLLHLFLD